MIQINNINAFYGIFTCLFATMWLLVLTIKTNKKYVEDQKQSVSTKTLRTIYITTLFILVSTLVVRVMQSFMETLPDLANNINQIISLGIGATNAVYTLIFIVKTFSVHPKESILSSTYYILGFSWGMILISFFDTDKDKMALQNIIGIVVLSVSIITIYYALISMRRQKIHLIKASMRYYAIGNILFLIIMLSSIMAEPLNIDTILLDNALRIGQVLQASFTYIAFFKPSWFKKKYSHEVTYIEKMFDNITLVNEKKR